MSICFTFICYLLPITHCCISCEYGNVWWAQCSINQMTKSSWGPGLMWIPGVIAGPLTSNDHQSSISRVSEPPFTRLLSAEAAMSVRFRRDWVNKDLYIIKLYSENTFCFIFETWIDFSWKQDIFLLHSWLDHRGGGGKALAAECGVNITNGTGGGGWWEEGYWIIQALHKTAPHKMSCDMKQGSLKMCT